MILHEEVTNREIVTRRVLDAPRELVYQAWTEAEHLSQWWGPRGFTNTFHEFNPEPTGVWRFLMHSPKGTVHKNKSVFLELVKPERIIFNHVSGPQFQAVATFADLAGRTRFTYRMIFKSPSEAHRVKKFAVESNEQTFDRLEAYLEKMAVV